MATSISLINDALFSIGATSTINPAAPELINASFRRMIQWITQMTASGILIAEDSNGVPIAINIATLPTDPASELGNAPATDLSLAAGLAPWVAPLFKITLAPGSPAKAAADHAMQYLYTVSMLPNLPEWPETLPIGAGNERGPKGRVFFPVPVVSFTRNDDGSVT